MDPRERNRLANRYKKEADEFNIGSPYRIDEYIRYRLRGMSPETAIKKVRSKETGK